MLANIFHMIYGIRYLLAVVSMSFVFLYKNSDDIRTIIVSIKASELLFNVKKNSENNWLDI